MKTIHSFFTLLALALPLGTKAQPNPVQPQTVEQPSVWSLKDCIDLGLKNFGSIRIAQNQTEIARQQAKEAIAGYLPQLSGVGTVDDNIKLQSTLLPAGAFGNPEPTRLTLGSKYQTNISASAEQVIYDKSLLIGIKAAKPNEKRAELNTRQTREEVIYNITSNYYQVLVVQQQIGLLQDNLNKTQQVLNILKLQRDNGVIQPVDYDRTEVGLNNTRSQLALAENNLALALNRLKFQMGISQEQRVVVSNTILKGTAMLSDAQFDARNLADFQLSQTNLELQRLDRERIKAGYLPRLSVNARYGSLALGNELLPSLNNFTGFGGVGLKLTVPIFDGFRRQSQIKQSQLTIQNLEEQQKLNTASYQLQFNNAQTQLQKSQINMGNDDRNVKLAQRVYDITTLQYKQGTKPLTDLINAENSYREAQTNYINSLLNFYQARLDLEQSQGTLLTFYNQL